MSWKVRIDIEDGNSSLEEVVETPHLHVAIDTVLYRTGFANAKDGGFQITATSQNERPR